MTKRTALGCAVLWCLGAGCAGSKGSGTPADGATVDVGSDTRIEVDAAAGRDAGLDAGIALDTGTAADTGTGADAGTGLDAGTGPDAGGLLDAGGDADLGEIIPEDRRVDWKPGIPGGIPDRSQICADVTAPPYSAAGNGVADDASAIQAAIDACPEGQVLHFPAGTYRVTSTLFVQKGIVLRGDGPGLTRIEGDGTAGRGIVNLGEEWDFDGQPLTSVASGFTKGSTELVVGDASLFTVGDFVIVDQLNDGDLVSLDASESECVWGSRDNGTRLLGQIVEVTSVNAASGAMGIDPPLAMTLSASLSPEMMRLNSNVTRFAGIEDLLIADRSYRGGNHSNLRIHTCAYCWAKNVESDMVSGRHIEVNRSFRCEVRDSFVHHAHCYNPGANAYGIAVDSQTSDTLVENNISYYLNVGYVMESSGPGNVIAYNHGDVMWDSNFPNTGWLMADFSANHCAHPFMTLFEGNFGSQFSADDIHGGSSHATYLRNTLDHQHEGITVFSNEITAIFAARNRYMNVVGNVFGLPGDVGETDADQNCDEGLAVYKLGWPSDCAAGPATIDPQVAATLLRHGNFDYVTGQTHWDDAIAQRSLPASLYLADKPAFFGALAWPAVGPDLDPMVGTIPAKVRFDAMPHDSYGGTTCGP